MWRKIVQLISVLVLYLAPSTCLLLDSASASNQQAMRILALFSGTKNDLGLDHRLGRQVLKLAINRARQLNPNSANIELIVHSDDTDCNRLNLIPNKVAEEFYYTNLLADNKQQCSLANNSQGQPNCGEELDDQLDHLQDIVSARGAHRASGEAGARNGPMQRVDAILGPSCDFLVDLVARMAAYWRTPMYSVTSIGAAFARKDVYSTLTRLSPSIDQLSEFVLRTLERFRWKHLAIIVDESQVEEEILLVNLERAINRLRFALPIERKVFKFSSFNSSISSQREQVSLNGTKAASASKCTREAAELLLGARRVARVFLMLLNDNQVIRQLLLCAHELQMNNGEFTFLAINLGLRSSPPTISQATTAPPAGNQLAGEGGKLIDSPQQQQQQQQPQQTIDWYLANDEANNLLARQMFESLMVISVQLPIGDEYNYFVEQTLDLAQQEYPTSRFERSSVGPVAVGLHDSLLLAVEAFNRRKLEEKRSASLQATRYNISSGGRNYGPGRTGEGEAEELELDDEDEDEDDLAHRGRERKADLFWNERYSNGLMTGLHINSNGDQELDYVLSDLEPEMGAMRPVARYVRESNQVQLLPNTYIHWPSRRNALTRELINSGDEPPPDEPECGFNEDAERCIDRQNLHAILSIIGLLIVLVLISSSASLYKYRKIKYQMQLDDYWWKINWFELKFIQVSEGESVSSGPRSVARALRSGGSLVSFGAGLSADGASSVVSLMRSGDRSLASATGGQSALQLADLTKSSQASAAGALRRVAAAGKRRPGTVPTIVTTTTSEVAPTTGESAASSGQRQPVAANASLAGSGTRSALAIKSEFSSVVRTSNLALYKNSLVIVKLLNADSLNVTRELLVELRSMRELISDNLAKFMGLCIEPQKLSIVYEYCSRGSLQDMLLNETIAMDWTLKYSIIGDIISGLNFIHTTLLDYHGRLKSTNLVLDGRFTVKITDFGLQNLYSQLNAIENRDGSQEEADEEDGDEDEADGRADNGPASGGLNRRPGKQLQADQLSVSQSAYNMESVSVRGGANGDNQSRFSERLRRRHHSSRNRGAARYFWTAPEHLRDKNPHFAGSKRGDVYALAIILYEMLTRREPYYYGTNAKPSWQTIKRDRRHQVQMQMQAKGAKRNSEVSSLAATNSIVGGPQARKRPSKFKRNSAIVGPLETGETNSGASSLASQASGRSQARQSVVATESRQPISRQVKASARATNNQIDQQLADELLDEITSIKSYKQGKKLTGPAAILAPHSASSDGKPVDPEEILDQLRMGIQPEPIRPYLPNYVLQEANSRLIELMHSCWHETPSLRPNLGQIRSLMRRITKGVASKNYLDNLLDRLQNYAADLEQIVDHKSADILEEKFRTEELLFQLVPKFVADKLKRNEPIIPQVFDGVTIFFSDIVGFEKYASVMSPIELVDLLNSIYSSFDSIISSFDVTKIETIIDQFLVASGISFEQENNVTGFNESRQLAGEQVNDSSNARPGNNEQQQQQQPAAGKVGSIANKRKQMRRSKSKKGPGLLSSLGSLRKQTSDSMDSNLGSPDTDSGPPGDQNEAANNPTCDPLNQVVSRSGPDLNHYKRTSAEQVARMALCIRDLVKSFSFRQTLTNNSNEKQPPKKESTGGQLMATNFNIRIGIHSGKVCAGIVGVKRPKFCLIGDTVNVASRMHTNSKANRIQISGDTKQLLEQVPGFNIEARGKIEVKGKGMMETFWLESSY